MRLRCGNSPRDGRWLVCRCYRTPLLGIDSNPSLDAVEGGETVRVYRNGRPVADIVPVKAAMPAWKKPPQTRLSLGSLSLGDEVLADRDEQR